MTTTTRRDTDARPAPAAPAPARGFIPALEGMRAIAALAVLTTHVAFQTGHSGAGALNRAFGRLDMSVALFFGLSGFLLWRGHALAARGKRERPGAARYLRSRIVRIMPAYLAVTVAVLWLLPEAGGTGWAEAAANLTLTQVFVPYALIGGLTQMWSMSVEMAFYLVLPAIAWSMAALAGARARLRIPVLLAAAALSLGWGWVALPLPAGVNTYVWLPGFVSWFVAGMVLAELVAAPPGRLRRWAGRRRLWWSTAAVVFVAACTDLSGPPGLVHPAPWQYALKTLFGALLAFLLLGPLVLDRRAERLGERRAHPVLASPVMLALGRWSYALFLWHVAVLSMVFPMLSLPAFSGHMPAVWAVTVVVSLGISAASYGLIEEPARRALVRWESRRTRARSAAETRAERGPAAPPGTAAKPATVTASSAHS